MFDLLNLQKSHPVGIDGKNHIIAMPPLKFLPINEFGKSQKSIDTNKTRSLMGSMKAKQLKIMGNEAFQQRKYFEAEKLYSKAIELDVGSRPLWTNRAACRNTMKKYDGAISDCDQALSIDPNCTRSTIEKGNALLGLSRFDEAKEVYETLRTLGEDSSADSHLKKLRDAQARILYLKILNFVPKLEGEK